MNDEFDSLLDDIASDAEPSGPSRTKMEAKPENEERRSIIIDEVDGQPNYEVVGVNGVVFQIQRGIETMVPLSVIEVLKNAVASKYVKVKRNDGFEDLQKRDYSSIPWRLV